MGAIILPQELRSCTQTRTSHSLHAKLSSGSRLKQVQYFRKPQHGGLTHPILPLKSARIWGGIQKCNMAVQFFFTDLNPTDQGDYRCEQQTPIPVWGLVVGSGTLQCSRRSTAQLCHPEFQQSNWPSLPLTINCSSSDL